MLEKNYVVISLDEKKSKVWELRSFEAKEFAEHFQSICNLDKQYLMKVFHKIQEVPSDIEMIDQRFREYSSWPDYIVLGEKVWKDLISNPDFVFPPQ